MVGKSVALKLRGLEKKYKLLTEEYCQESTKMARTTPSPTLGLALPHSFQSPPSMTLRTSNRLWHTTVRSVLNLPLTILNRDDFLERSLGLRLGL